MINTAITLDDRCTLAGTPQPYQGFAPIGEFKPRQQKSAAGRLQDLLDAPSYTPTGSGSGQGTGTGDGTGSRTGTGTDTGTGGGLGGNARKASRQAARVEIVRGICYRRVEPRWRAHSRSDLPIGYPDWQSVAKAIEWEQEHKGEVRRHGVDQ